MVQDLRENSTTTENINVEGGKGNQYQCYIKTDESEAALIIVEMLIRLSVHED